MGLYQDAWELDQWLSDAGLLDPGQSTMTSHTTHKREMERSFTPIERRLIRALFISPAPAKLEPE